VKDESHSASGRQSSVPHWVIHVAQLGSGPIKQACHHHGNLWSGLSNHWRFLVSEQQNHVLLWAIVPLIGFCLATAGMLINPTILMAFLMAIDVVIILSCFYLSREAECITAVDLEY